MKIIANEQLPAANGHYSTSIISNNLLLVSGKLPVSTDGTHHNNEPFGRQFEVVSENNGSVDEAWLVKYKGRV